VGMEEEEQEEQLPKAVAKRSPAASPTPPPSPTPPKPLSQTDVVNLYIGYHDFYVLLICPQDPHFKY